MGRVTKLLASWATPGRQAYDSLMELDTAASTVEVTDNGITLRWSNGDRSRFNSLWLRDNCPSGGDKRKDLRTFSVVDLDPDLSVVDAYRNDEGDLEVAFSDGHISVFDFDWLRDHSYEPYDRRNRVVHKEHFRAGAVLETIPMPEQGTEGHLELLTSINIWGVAIVEGVPLDVAGSEALAALIGNVRETDFGRLFDIVVEPDPCEVSQTELAVDPHTEDPYRYSPSGCSFLHCVESVTGGDSLFVDGFAIAEDLRDDDPDAFDLLCEIAVPFIYERNKSVDRGQDVHLVANAPIISLDRDHEICGIRFHERSMAPLDVDPALMDRYYRALISFARMANDPSRTVQLQLQPGQAIVYDNQRVLHGRSAYTLNGGRRHFRLGTIDRDQFHSRLRRLREDHGRPGVSESLPQGSVA